MEDETIRSIPTRVGKSSDEKQPVSHYPVHPHAGGEIDTACDENLLAGGPSPRGWGNHAREDPFNWGQRSIPTRVGKSLEAASHPLAGAVHPHAGGEIWDKPVEEICKNGPSPRGWGNQKTEDKIPRLLRSIPTRVGKSGS